MLLQLSILLRIRKKWMQTCDAALQHVSNYTPTACLRMFHAHVCRQLALYLHVNHTTIRPCLCLLPSRGLCGERLRSSCNQQRLRNSSTLALGFLGSRMPRASAFILGIPRPYIKTYLSGIMGNQRLTLFHHIRII